MSVKRFLEQIDYIVTMKIWIAQIEKWLTTSSVCLPVAQKKEVSHEWI